MNFLFQMGYTLSEGNFELSSSEDESEDINTSEDNNVIQIKEAEMVIVEMENRGKNNSTKEEPASKRLIMLWINAKCVKGEKVKWIFQSMDQLTVL